MTATASKSSTHASGIAGSGSQNEKSSIDASGGGSSNSSSSSGSNAPHSAAVGFNANLNLFVFQLISGGTAGALAKTAVAPLERVKVLMQIQGSSSTAVAASERYTGVIDALRRIPQREGWRAFYRGNGTNVARIIPDAAIKFTLNDQFKMMFAPADGTPIGIAGKLAAGACAGALKVSVLYPLDIARTRLTADTTSMGKEKYYNGMVDCIRKTAQTEGLKGVYKGWGVSVVGILPYVAIIFTAYDEFKLMLPSDQASRDSHWYPLAKMSVGGAAGVMAQCICYPLDTVRKRMQINGGAGFANQYTSTTHCMRTMWANEGLRGFYRGLTATVIKIAPGAAIQLFVYDHLRQFLTGRDSFNTRQDSH